MTQSDNIERLQQPVSIKVRVDGTQVAVIKTDQIGPRTACLPVADLPLTVDSFIELELFDGADRLIVPARVCDVGEIKLTVEYEQTGQVFEHWLQTQTKAQP